NGGRAHHDSLYRDHHLLGAGCSYCCISMGRLDPPDNRDRDFYLDSEFGRPLLCAADCRKLRWLTSDDGNRVDFCLGLDHWWNHWSAPVGAAYFHAQSTCRTLRWGPAFTGTISAYRNGSHIRRNRSVE